jgi:hypothetical protein
MTITTENVVTAAIGLALLTEVFLRFRAQRDGEPGQPRIRYYALDGIVGILLLLGVVGPGGLRFQLPGPSESSTTQASIQPTRMAAGPGQYPPKRFRAYGIVAFKSRLTSANKDRYNLICEAYVSAISYYGDVKAPLSDQMVTVWPVESVAWADKINAERREKVCADAVPHYDLTTALDAIDSARKNGASLDGLGPFLLAWSPGAAKGEPDSLVLVADMSDVINDEQSHQLLDMWVQDIQHDSSLWYPTWDPKKLNFKIRLWFDKWGTRLLATYQSNK